MALEQPNRRPTLISRAWRASLDNPLTRRWVKLNNWLWAVSPLSSLLPLDLEEVWAALVEVSADLVARPQARRERMIELLQHYNQLAIYATRRGLTGAGNPPFQPAKGDRRFSDKAWTGNLYFDVLKQSYLITATWLNAAAQDIEGLDPRTHQRVNFYIRQFADMLSPTNFALTNPEVLREMLDTGGENLRRGLNNLLDDLQRGEVKVAGKEQFKIGVNLALTPGQVVYRNELIELIQYAPKTEQVYRIPIVIIPPWINKYYIMDIRPGRSMVEYLVGQGFTVFLMSWRNPTAELEGLTMEDYLRLGPLESLKAARAITAAPQAHLVGYCLGGTLLSILLAYLAASGDRLSVNGLPITDHGSPITPAAATFFTALQDFSEVGETAIFISEEWVAEIERRTERKGYLDAVEMSSIFRLLRSNDLIWSFVVNNYLLGKEPLAFDLMYWSVDGTRMPRTVHSYYLRNCYLENNLVKPNTMTMFGQGIDLGQVRCPCYVVAGSEDHIVPWQSAHKARRLFSGPTRLVLSGGGHITAIINPPTGKGYYLTNDADAPNPDAWLKGAKRTEGSWWPDWAKWLAGASAEKVAPPPMGNDEYRPLVAAPGTYVLE